MTSKKSVSSAPSNPRKRAKAEVAAAGFTWSVNMGGISRPVWMAPMGGATMIDTQKGRNNYYKMAVALQASMCRRSVERNWFLRPVMELRHACHMEGFRAVDANRVDMAEQYDFHSLVADITHEDLVTSNVVCLWRKKTKLPVITVMDMESVEYSAGGGVERITITYGKDDVLAKDKKNAAQYIKALGERVYKAYTTGGKVEIIKGVDAEWDFEVMISGKRRGCFCIPQIIPVMDSLDFLELMGVGDWNLAWFRKDVIRAIRKGYKASGGQTPGLNSVDISTKDIKDLGTGFAAVNGTSNIPMNHDVDPSYITMPPENFRPDQVKTALDKLMLFGGIEAVVLLGSFSQQNGAAPSLMRNARVAAFKRRMEVEKLLRRIFAADEFKGLDWGGDKMNFEWSVKSLYSLDELLSMVKGTNDGTASPQTRRSWLDLDNEVEVENHKAAHADREGYAPPFEAGQALLPAMFPDELGSQGSGDTTGNPHPSPAKPPEPPGRPKKVKS